VQTESGYQLVRLNNGICSVRSLADAETFHPVVGPVAEAEALYVNQLRLRERLQNHTGEFVIWDVGLGAAANALTVLRATRNLTCRIRLVSFDHTLEPLKFALKHAADLGYFGGYENHLEQFLREHRAVFHDGNQSVEWEFHLGDFPAWLSNSKFKIKNSKLGCAPRAILFDAFSPAKNPAMWTLPLFTNLFQMLDPQRSCALPTYSRSTILRVTLLLAIGLILAALAIFLISAATPPAVTVEWSTASELNTAGFNIFRVTERKADHEYALEEVKDELPGVVSEMLFREKLEEWVKGLRAKAHIQINKS